MKVSELINFLNTLNPEEHECAHVYEKGLFADEEMTLTDAAWEEICNNFDEQGFDDIFMSLQMAVADFYEDPSDE